MQGGPRQFVMAYVRPLALLKYIQKKLPLYRDMSNTDDCLWNAETVSGELVIAATCRHFGTLIS